MSFISKHSRILIVAVSCAVVGAGASAIATAGASTSPTPAKTSTAHAGRGRGLGRWERRAVEGRIVIRTQQGFKAVTFERGTVQSVSGQQLTLVEGTAKATYKTVTLTIPADAHVRDNGSKSTLSSVTSGQRALVVTGPKTTYVFAHTPRAA